MSDFSTRNLQGFPPSGELARACQAAALLDAVLQPTQWLRYHFYFPRWDEHLRAAKIDNGSGDHLYVLFSPRGAVLKGFDHESELSPYATDEDTWPNFYALLPPELLSLLDDPAFEKEAVTFCLWQLPNAPWQGGSAPPEADDGSGFLLDTIPLAPADYLDWARDYYQRDVSAEAVQRVYEKLRMNEATARALNPDLDFAALATEIAEIEG